MDERTQVGRGGRIASAIFSPADTAPVVITVACCRHRSPRSTCAVCVDACPAGALSLRGGHIALDSGNCVSCGACLFACPVGAIDGRTLTRTMHGGALLATNDVAAPHPNELLQWATTRGVRTVLIERAAPSRRWREHIAAANAILLSAGLPPLTIDDTKAAFATLARTSRRDLLGLRPQCEGATTTRRVAIQPRPLAALVPDIALHRVDLDVNTCSLCGACTRICRSGAITIGADNGEACFAIDQGLCSGCGLCAATCLEQALTVSSATAARERVRHHVVDATCVSCGQPFHAWKGGTDRCHICAKRETLYGDDAFPR